MPLIVHLPAETERDLQSEASALGLDSETFVRQIIVRRLQRSRSRRISLAPEERTELASLDAELTPAFWARYRALQDRAGGSEGDMGVADRAELIALTERAEEWNIRRLTLLDAMAQKRGIRFPELMKSLHLSHHPDAIRA